MANPTSIYLTDDLDRRLRNYMLRERRPNRSEAMRVLLEDGLDLAEGKRDGDLRLIALGELDKERRAAIRKILDDLDAADGA